MKLTPKQKEVLINALAHDGDMRITNNGLKSSLMKKGLITYASGYGWGFGGIQTLTREGERVAILLKAAEQCVQLTCGGLAYLKAKVTPPHATNASR